MQSGNVPDHLKGNVVHSKIDGMKPEEITAMLKKMSVDVTGMSPEEMKAKLKSMADDPKMKSMFNMQADDFIFVELSADDIKLIDGLAAGTFTAMNGTEFTFPVEKLQSYIEKTNVVLESTKDSNGEIVGLPIDLLGHDHKGGAGWIVGMQLDKVRNIIQLAVKWTQAGIDAIKSNTRRFFSPSFDPEKEIFLGGSLTNYPATRNASGQILLRPVEFSQSIKEIDMEKTLEGAFEAIAELKTLLQAALKPAELEKKEDAKEETEVDTSVQLSKTLASISDVDELSKQAAELAQQHIAADKRKRDAVEFSARIAGGTSEKPFGLKVKPQRIVRLLLSLPEAQANEVKAILSANLDAAIDFASHGFENATGFPVKPGLPADYQQAAKIWVESGGKIQDWLKEFPELGKASDYNLAEFETVKE